METFTWQDVPYAKIFLRTLCDMQKEGDMCDITLVVNNLKIRAHKLVLSAVSPYFRTMESAGLKESIENEIIFSDIKFEILQSIIHFMYTGEIEINENNVYDIMSASHMFQMSFLKLAISHYIIRSLNIKNCLESLAYAKLYGYEELCTVVLKYITKNVYAAINSESFNHIPVDLLTLILNQSVSNLDALYLAFHKWLTNNTAKNRYLDFATIFTSTIGNYTDYLQKLLDPDFTMLSGILRKVIMENYPNMNVEMRRSYLKEIQVVVSIGGSSKGTILSSVECNSGTNGWSMFLPPSDESDQTLGSIVPTMKEPRMCCAVACIKKNGGEVFVLGGVGTASKGSTLDICERYDVRTNTWHAMQPLPQSIRNSAAAIVDGVLYLTGGMQSSGVATAETWEYYQKNDRWRPITPMFEARHSHGTCSVNSTLYVLGGCSESGIILSSVERYNSDLQKWHNVCEMPEPKSEFGCISFKEYIYVIGGSKRNLVLNSVHRYNVLTDKWELCADMPAPKSGFGCTLKDKKIYCIGGSNTVHGPLATVEVYNPRTNRWHYLQDKLLTPRGYNVAATISILSVHLKSTPDSLQ